MSLTATT